MLTMIAGACLALHVPPLTRRETLFLGAACASTGLQVPVARAFELPSLPSIELPSVELPALPNPFGGDADAADREAAAAADQSRKTKELQARMYAVRKERMAEEGRRRSEDYVQRQAMVGQQSFGSTVTVPTALPPGLTLPVPGDVNPGQVEGGRDD